MVTSTCSLHVDVFVYRHVNRFLIIRNSNSNNIPKIFIKNTNLFQKVHATVWMDEKSEFESRQGQEAFLFSLIRSTALSHSNPVASGGFIPGLNQMGREGYHTPPYSTKVNNVCSYTYTLHVLMAW